MEINAVYERVSWRYNTNIYEVNIRQYTEEGTFNAFVKELPRLKDMGVETLWFMPVTPIAKEKMKGTMGSYYACSDYTSINPEFGTLDDFKKLVDIAHETGFRVIIDWVANHTGWDHVWTKSNPEYFERDENGSFKAASGMDDIIELDYTNQALVKAMIEAMAFWVKECNLDGFRCDLASWVPLDFWKQARSALEQIRPLFWLGEFDVLENSEYLSVFDVAYMWTWMHKTEDFYKRERNVPLLKTLLDKCRSILPSGTAGLFFTSNHDENSWNGTEYEKYGDMAPALAVLSCIWEGVPLVYSGQELPNRKRLKFFDKDIIEWNGSYILHDFYKKLLTLHTTHAALSAADGKSKSCIIDLAGNKDIIINLRQNEGREVLLLVNLSPYPSRFYIDDIQLNGKFKELFSGEEKDCSSDKWFELKTWGYNVFVK